MKENKLNEVNQLGIKLLEKRKSLGLTQDTMAKALDLSTVVYGQIEREIGRAHV